MKKFILFSISLLTLICSFIILPNKKLSVKASSVNNSFIIQAYGDSISYGETLSNRSDAYPNIFAKPYVDTFNAKFYANGESGSTTADLLQYLQPYKNRTASDINKFDDTDIVVLCIGANNVLIPAINNIGNYISGNMTNTEFNALLDEKVNQFKRDYPQILDTFKNKKVIVMTVYNPYKYTSLNDISIDPSLSSSETTIRYTLSSFNTKLQEMLNTSMEHLQQINDEIRKSANENITVVDVWDLFSKFSKTQYLQYINADISKVTIDMSDIFPLLNGNISSILNKITNNCDPHPTKEGHMVIAQHHFENYKNFKLKAADKKNDNNTLSISISSNLPGTFVYKYYKQSTSGKTLLAETTNSTFNISKQKLTENCTIYAEIYYNGELIEITDFIDYTLTQNDSENIWLYVAIIALGILLSTVPFIISVINKSSQFR